MSTRVYNPRRGRVHLARTGNEFVTFCGLWDLTGWHGTGSQDEYEEAARRRLCKRCERRSVWKST